MNISYSWLRAIIPGLRDSPDEVAANLARIGAPVEEMIQLGEPLSTIVVGRVINVGKHPNADRLSLCEVEAGSGETLQVVCGAPNVRAGAYYPFAPVGSHLPGGIRIRRAKIRGVESQGMLCSERELGLGRDQSGLMELHGDLEPGEELVAALGLDDLRIVIDLTPNRPDLLSHLGVARELATRGVDDLVLPTFPGYTASAGASLSLSRSESEGETGGVHLRLEDPVGCMRYLGAIVHGVEIAPSPNWLASRLRAIGLRPINNVVDATNYILYELGQPLHAFDLDQIGGREVRIRRARPGEKIRTLDGEERILDESMTVIADADRALAIAGVMGGEESEVTMETTSIFLECALFDPRSTRKARTAVGLSTDASYRFERGVDPEAMEGALRRAVDLIIAVAGGEAVTDAVDLYPEPTPPLEVEIRPERATLVLGQEFTGGAIVELLEPLGFRVVGKHPDQSSSPARVVTFQIPGYRSYDVRREADLIEEVARRYGYERFPAEMRAFRPSTVLDDPMAVLEDRLRDHLIGRGFLEARLTPFSGERGGEVGPINPLSSTESMLRHALIPGLLRRTEANFAHGTRTIRLFEIGTTFFTPELPVDPPREETHLAIVMSGATRPTHWTGAAPPYDLWDLKGLMTELAGKLSADLEIEIAGEGLPLSIFEAGRAYQIVGSDGEVYGWGGEIDKDAIDSPPWAKTTYALEFVLRPSFTRVEGHHFNPIPAYPAIERDIALLIPDELPVSSVEAEIDLAGGELLEGIIAFDLFRGEGLPEGHRSVAYRLRFRAWDRTLTDNDADQALGDILNRLRKELGVQRRG